MESYRLRSGKVYRTEDLVRFGTNSARLASQLVKSGKLRLLQKGLYYAPRQSVFGEVPPSEAELLRAFFRGRPYLRTGPSVWNTLGLGSTSVEAVPLVYNTTRTGEVCLAGRRFQLRRVKFPRRPNLEYFVIDLLENRERAGLDRETAGRALAAALKAGGFDRGRLQEQAQKYGSLETQGWVTSALRRAQGEA